MAKRRLDDLLVERGLAADLRKAQALIMAGKASVDGARVDKPGVLVKESAVLTLEGIKEYVSRGAYKLKAALDQFPLKVEGEACADVGAATGGFTQVLLRAGASRVYAVDVGYGDLAYELRQDPRVTLMERTNVRSVATLPEPIALVAIDVSFISLRLVLPVVRGWLKPDGAIAALVKPQFEAAREEVGEGGIVRDPAVHRKILRELLIEWAPANSITCRGLIRSPIEGAEGNREFVALLRSNDGAASGTLSTLEELIESVIR